MPALQTRAHRHGSAERALYASCLLLTQTGFQGGHERARGDHLPPLTSVSLPVRPDLSTDVSTWRRCPGSSCPAFGPLRPTRHGSGRQRASPRPPFPPGVSGENGTDGGTAAPLRGAHFSPLSRRQRRKGQGSCRVQGQNEWQRHRAFGEHRTECSWLMPARRLWVSRHCPPCRGRLGKALSGVLSKELLLLPHGGSALIFKLR